MIKSKLSPCAQQIFKTLKYRAIFRYPLTKYQLYNTLICDIPVKEKVFSEELARLVKKGDVKNRRELYYISGYKPVDWDKRAEMSEKYLKKAREVSKILSVIPWIKMISVTGSVANYNAETKGDIDFFIISQKNRVWLTRGFTSLFLILLNMYRTDKNPCGKVCPNLFIDEENMAWPKNKRNLFTAQQIISMHPIFNKDETYFKFIKTNQWLFGYFNNFNINLSLTKATKKEHSSGIVDVLENIARVTQTLYMQKKHSKEIIQKGFIHFNREDWTDKILNSFNS